MKELNLEMKEMKLYHVNQCYFFQKMDTIVSPTLDLAEIRPKDSEAAQHSKLTHI